VKSVCQSWFGAVVLSLNSSAAFIWEYYWTNVRGATNVCKFASDVGANYLLFTSTMMVYGPTEAPKDEDSLLEPVNAYGRRKSSPRASTAYGNRSVPTRGG